MRRLLAAMLLSSALLAGCGASSNSPTSAANPSAPGATSAARGGSATSTSSSPGSGPSRDQFGADLLAFAKCMRANGVSNFSDPKAVGGAVSIHMPTSAPAFETAQARCHKLLPDSGTGPPVDPHALVQLRQIAVCVRQHGVPDFPDPKQASTISPRGGVPSGQGANGRVTNYRGALLEFPATLNTRSPAFEQAARACGGAFLNNR